MIPKQAKTKQRLGRFLLNVSQLQHFPEPFKQLFGQMIIWKADHHISAFGDYMNAIEYTAIYDGFDEINEGDVIPKYRFLWNKGENGETIMLPVEKCEYD